MPAPAVTQAANQLGTRSTEVCTPRGGAGGSLQFRSCKPCCLGPYPTEPLGDMPAFFPAPRPANPALGQVHYLSSLASTQQVIATPSTDRYSFLPPSAPTTLLPPTLLPLFVRQIFSYSQQPWRPKIALDNYHFLRFQQMASCETPALHFQKSKFSASTLPGDPLQPSWVCWLKVGEVEPTRTAFPNSCRPSSVWEVGERQDWLEGGSGKRWRLAKDPSNREAAWELWSLRVTCHQFLD